MKITLRATRLTNQTVTVIALPKNDSRFGFVSADLNMADAEGELVFTETVKEHSPPNPKRSLLDLLCADKRRGRLLFVNKKKQKNFYNLGRARVSATGSNGTKVFAPLFSKSGCFPVSS